MELGRPPPERHSAVAWTQAQVGNSSSTSSGKETLRKWPWFFLHPHCVLKSSSNIPLTCSKEFYISVLQKIFTYSVNELSDKMVPFKIRSKQLEKQTIPSEYSELLLLDTSIWYCDWQVQQSHHCTDLSEVEWCTTRCIPII